MPCSAASFAAACASPLLTAPASICVYRAQALTFYLTTNCPVYTRHAPPHHHHTPFDQVHILSPPHALYPFAWWPALPCASAPVKYCCCSAPALLSGQRIAGCIWLAGCSLLWLMPTEFTGAAVVQGQDAGCNWRAAKTSMCTGGCWHVDRVGWRQQQQGVC